MTWVENQEVERAAPGTCPCPEQRVARVERRCIRGQCACPGPPFPGKDAEAWRGRVTASPMLLQARPLPAPAEGGGGSEHPEGQAPEKPPETGPKPVVLQPGPRETEVPSVRQSPQSPPLTLSWATVEATSRHTRLSCAFCLRPASYDSPAGGPGLHTVRGPHPQLPVHRG